MKLKLIEYVIIIFVFLTISVVLSWFLSEYIEHHLHIPFMVLFLIGVFCPPLWYLLLALAFLTSMTQQKPPSYPSYPSYPMPYYPVPAL